MTNRRIYYPTAGFAISPVGTTSVTSDHIVHGGQTIGIETNFNLERVFEIGQSTEYEAVEEVPDVSINVSKVLDGYCPLYLLATNGASNATLQGRADVQTIASLFVYPEDHVSASGNPLTQADTSGCYVGSVGYNFPAEDNFTEDLSLVANHKTWRTSGFTFTGTMFDDTDQPLSITGSGGINRREDMIFLPEAGGTKLPPDVAGITSSGTNESNNDVFGASIQNISVTADFGRTGLKELGRKKDYYKFRAPVTTVTTEIEIIAKTGDMVDAREDTDNLNNREIFIKTREGLQLDLGSKNKLASSSMGGLDAGGENVTASYTFENANFLTVQHPQDITTALRP